MSQIRHRNTKPEILLKKALRAAGITGYRSHVKLKGSPDMYFASKKLAVFIDGCFWHRCPQCFVRPRTNRKFWDEKIAKNVIRDKRVNRALKKKGITVLRFWQHEIKGNVDKCCAKLTFFTKSLV